MSWPDLFFRRPKTRQEPVPPLKADPEPGKSSKSSSRSTLSPSARPGVLARTRALPAGASPEPASEPVEEQAAPAVEARSVTGPILLKKTDETTAQADLARRIQFLQQVATQNKEAATPKPKAAPDENSLLADPEPGEAGQPFGSLILTGATSLRRKARLTDVAKMIATPKVEPAPTASQALPSVFVTPPADPAAPVPENVVEEEMFDEEEDSFLVGPPLTVATPSEPEKKEEPAPVEIAAAPENTPAPMTEVAAPVEPPPVIETPQAEAVAEPAPAPSSAPLVEVKEKKEFLLTNGERILGRILSESADTIYLEHNTLGVLTLPRKQIAARPVEIFLINGDRIVGDIMAETDEVLYVRHALLGMLTVPRAQRSQRVVEVTLKDGDRLVGEALTEKDGTTVLRSATLGTVLLPHAAVAHMNRKIEKMELKTLPAPDPHL